MQFLPLDSLPSATAQRTAALESAQTYVDILRLGGADSTACEATLARALNAADTCAGSYSWAHFSAGLIGHIFEVAGITNISTGLYGSLKRTTEWHNGLVATLQELAANTKGDGGALIADRGGALLIENRDAIYEYREIAVESDGRLALRGHNAPNIMFGESETNRVHIRDVKGPVEVQVLSKLGTLPHLPWYGRWVADSGVNAAHREWIRPIVVADPARTPTAFKPALRPSGYSLIDYLGSTDTPLILGAAGVAEKQLPALLRELTSIASHLPAIRQKAQKSQSGVRAFRAQEENEWIAALREGRQRYANSPHTGTVGDELLYMVAVLGCLRSRLSEGPSALPAAGSHLALQGITSIRELNTDKVIEACRRAVLDGVNFLQRRGQARNSLSKAIDRFDRGCKELEKMDGASFGGITGHALRDSGIGWMIAGLRMIADAYFAWQLFLLATLLKASIWPMYMLWGDELPSAIVRMLNQRDQLSLSYQPQSWSLRSSQSL